MAVLSYTSDNGISERIYALRINFAEVDNNMIERYREYFRLAGVPGALSEQELYITLKANTDLIWLLESFWAETDQDMPIKYVEHDDGVEEEVAEFLDTALYDGEYTRPVLSFDQSLSKNLYLLLGKQKVETVQTELLQLLKKINEADKPARPELNSKQAILLYHYFKSVLGMNSISRTVDSLIISLAFRVNSDEVYSSNTLSALEKVKDNADYCMNSKNIHSLLNYIATKNFRDKLRPHVDKLKAALEEDLQEVEKLPKF